jgi:hypothetical protein
VYFANKQASHSILSGARLVVNSVSSAPLTCLGSCLIALGPAWLSILYHFVAIAPTGLRAILLSRCLLIKKVD